jgi:hypothetical protein
MTSFFLVVPVELNEANQEIGEANSPAEADVLRCSWSLGNLSKEFTLKFPAGKVFQITVFDGAEWKKPITFPPDKLDDQGKPKPPVSLTAKLRIDDPNTSDENEGLFTLPPTSSPWENQGISVADLAIEVNLKQHFPKGVPPGAIIEFMFLAEGLPIVARYPLWDKSVYGS